jgi:putative glycosyltransferase (TIGR04372 family)
MARGEGPQFRDLLRFVFLSVGEAAGFEYLLAYQLANTAERFDSRYSDSCGLARGNYPLISAWIAQCFVEDDLAMPPVSSPQGIALADRILDGAEGHLRSIRAHAEADRVGALRAMIDANFAEAEARWILAPSFLSHVGHLVYAAVLVEMQRRGRLAAREVGILPGASHNRYLRQSLEPYVVPDIPPNVSYVESISARKRHLTTDRTWRTMSELVSEATEIWSGDRPFAEIDAETRQRGDAALAALGVPPDAPIVTLHVREAGYNSAIADTMSLRDARIADYREAIAVLAARGLRVVRLGDPSMTPAEPQEGLVDYPFTAAKSDWMDIYLAARCRFHIGTSSGMSFVPLAFGRPVLFTNWITMAHVVCASSVVTLPKLLLDADGAIVPLADYCGVHGHLLERSDADLYGLTFRDSAPEDIAEAARLMDDGTDLDTGRLRLPARLFKASQAVFAASPLKSRPQIAPGFWRRYYTGA